MFKRILRESLLEVAQYPTLVRIAFLTTFVHTLASFWRFGYTFYVVLEKNVDIANLEWTLLEYIRAIFERASGMSFGAIVALVVFFVIGYIFLYPIGHGMIVSYIADHSLSKALRVSLGKYFTITITEWLLAAVTFGGWHLLGLRYFYHRWILDNILIQIVVVLIGLFVIGCTFLYTYANIISVAGDLTESSASARAREALKLSSALAMDHPWITMKFMLLSIFLEVRFLITTILVIAVPAFLVRVALQLGLLGSQNVITVVLISVWLLMLAAIYINAIIDAFFTAYWYKLYRELQEKSAD